MDRNKLACNCNHVSYGQIIDCVKDGAITYTEVQEKTGCGKGCGKCKELIEIMIRNIQLFPEDYEQARKNFLKKTVDKINCIQYNYTK